MAIKDLLVYLDNDTECKQRIESAIELCQQQQAHLVGVYSYRIITTPSYIGAGMPIALAESNSSWSRSMLESVETLFNTCLEEAEITGEFRAVDRGIFEAIETHARYADVLVLPQEYNNEGLNEHFSIGSALISSPCPVLMLPNQNSTSLSARKALLAWDDSRESARAVQALLSLQFQLDKIDVVSIAEKPTVAIDIAQHISRHGVEAEAHVIEDNDAKACDRIQQMAATLGSDVIAMGAYGHSRIKQWVIGGATQRMTKTATLPVLFAH